MQAGRAGWWSRAIGLSGFVVGVALVPHRVCGAGADAWYRGDRETQEALAASVDGWLEGGRLKRAFSTGSPRFDSEWQFGTYQMAALGFGQVMLEHPESKARLGPAMERAILEMLAPEGHAFDTEAWGKDALGALDGAEGPDSEDGHVAFLGYLDVVLGLHRLVDPDSRFAGLNDAVTAALVRRLEHAPSRLLETYPGEIYPMDNASAVAAIGLHARATHAPVPEVARQWVDIARHLFVDPGTGLLVQSVHADGSRLDAPRGSGTALAAYFLSFGDASARALASELHQAVSRSLERNVLGFRAVREYAPHTSGGHGDIDSGPIVFGFGVSATGFHLAGCRVFGDAEGFRGAYATASLFGAPFTRDVSTTDRRTHAPVAAGAAGVGGERAMTTHVSGGPLGDAILFAMQTAQRRLP